MAHLYQITHQLIGLQHLIDDGELDADVLNDTMEGLQGDLQLKAEGILAFVANIGSDVKAIDDQIKRLTSRKKTMTTQQEWLRNYLKTNMQAATITKITCPLFSVTLGKAKPTAVVDDESLVPKKYKKTVPTTTQIVKADLLKALKKVSVPGAHLGESEQSLLIK